MCKKRQVIMLLAGVLIYSSAIANVTTLPSLSDEQARQLKAQLNLKTKNKTLNRLVTDAGPTIEKVLSMTACFAPGNTFGMYQSDQAGPGAIDQPYLFTHHDHSECVNVQRILDWKMTAKNALAFRVMFVSEQSGENIKKSYEVQKQLDGSWLFKRTFY